ncbi:hypothetical protein ASO14_1187 [Kurthia sp. 11kri321]|uniref:hypothetical protein n=1 Tax=Kurthia sp. 11kri321 TaxID=1750719 RepID=UPI000745CD1B|nr:hypothetical protein [Kurthia sp. 11kri321]AMA63098.1 hypothetical protein ASO14_1187 [Kurthia sp. 11kri321]
MQIHTHHLEFLQEAQEVFRENLKQVTYINDDGDLIALCYRYADETVPSIKILELGPEVAFFANILDTQIKID